MENPFQYGKVVSAPSFTDREEELEEILRDVSSAHNLVLYSPRRYGKTSLLFKVAEQARLLGYKTIYIDFLRVTSRSGFIELYAQEILKYYHKNWRATLKKIAKLASGIRPSMTLDPFGNLSFSINISPQADPRPNLEAVLDLPEQLDPRQKWLIIFDEFQEISRLNREGFEDILRSRLQLHQRCSYIFCGSQYHLLLRMFSDPGRPFYRFGKLMPLHKIPPELMKAFIMERFAVTGLSLDPKLAASILKITDNIPNYVQFIASELWQSAALRGSAPDQTMLDNVLEKVIDSQKDYFLQIWEILSPQQRKVLLALCRENRAIFSEDYHRRHHLGVISSSQRAVRKLVADQIIVKEDNEYLFSDPLFKSYLIKRIAII